MTHLHFDRQGQPVSLHEWADLFERDDRTLAADTISGYTVSTVWVGLDQGFGRSSRPLIFETMIFAAAPGSAHDLDCWRYATEAEALAGHADAVTLIRATAVDAESLLTDADDRETVE